jgi:hypothetical protein
MSRFGDEAFSLDGLNAEAEPLPDGGLVEIGHALRFQRLRARLLPVVTERVLRHLEERAAALEKSENRESNQGVLETHSDANEPDQDAL